MNIDLHELKTLATAAKSNPYDAVAGNDYGMAMPPAVALGLIAEIERHRQKTNTEGWKPEINIQPSGSHTAAPTAVRGLDKAEGEQPDLNFHLLQLAERSCSLLEDWAETTKVQDGDLTDQIKCTRTLLESQHPTWSAAIRDLLHERRRQIHEEGWSIKHDDSETQGELAAAAATYALKSIGMTDFESETWPWDREYLKPADPRRMLIKAGALILAELDRLDRRAAREAHHD